MNQREWYRFDAKTGSDVAELSIFGEIGGGFFMDEDAVTGKSFAAQLDRLPESVKTIRVRVNSPGGSVFDALHIANALRRQSQENGRVVEMEIEALAASAATIITSAGDSIKIPKNAVMMVHMPHGVTMGPASSMRKMAEALDRVTAGIVATYRWVSPLSPEAIQALMEDVTWMDSDEALQNGFVTEVMDAVEAKACIPADAVTMLGEIPEKFRDRIEIGLKPKPKPDPDEVPAAAKAADAKFVLTACEGLSPKLATVLLDLPEVEVTKRVAHAKEVGALCATAKLPELAEGYVLAHTPIATVKAHLTVVTAKMDQLEIDTRHDGVDPAKKPTVRLNSTEIYAARRTPQPALGTGR